MVLLKPPRRYVITDEGLADIHLHLPEDVQRRLATWDDAKTYSYRDLIWRIYEVVTPEELVHFSHQAGYSTTEAEVLLTMYAKHRSKRSFLLPKLEPIS